MNRFSSRPAVLTVVAIVVTAVIASTLIFYSAEAESASQDTTSVRVDGSTPGDGVSLLGRHVAQINGILATRNLRATARVMQIQQQAEAERIAAQEQAAADERAAQEQAEAEQRAAQEERDRQAAQRQAQQQTQPQADQPAAPQAQPAAPANQSVSPRDGIWDQLAQCETGGRWATNSVPGYSGGLGFAHSSWRDFGGHEFAPIAAQASREQQIVVAERILATMGWRAWPACSIRLGLR